jgi:hypothetical protein
VVVLPTPPFWLAIAMMFARDRSPPSIRRGIYSSIALGPAAFIHRFGELFTISVDIDGGVWTTAAPRKAADSMAGVFAQRRTKVDEGRDDGARRSREIAGTPRKDETGWRP